MSKNPGLFSRIFSKLTGKEENSSDEGYRTTAELNMDSLSDESLNQIAKQTERATEKFDFKNKYILEVMNGPDKGKAFRMNSSVIYLGKYRNVEQRNWILIDSPHISDEQALLKWRVNEGKFAVIHNQQANLPTYINEQVVDDDRYILLDDNSVIKVGELELLIKYMKGKDISGYSFEEGLSVEAESGSSQRVVRQKCMGEESPVDQTMEVAYEEAHMFQVTEGKDRERVITINKDTMEDKLVIGRKGGDRKDIELLDDEISDNYASLSLEGNWLCINLEDPGGEIVINDVSIVKKGLENGDIIKLGSTVMEHYLIGSQAVHNYATLEIINGSGTGTVFELKERENRIGRKSVNPGEPGKEIELSENDRSISRQHVLIEKRWGKFYLINRKDRNPTFLNGIHVNEPRPLVTGDKIKLGNEIVLLYEYNEPPLIIRDEEGEAVLSEQNLSELEPDKDEIFKKMEEEFARQSQKELYGASGKEAVCEEEIYEIEPDKDEIFKKMEEEFALQSQKELYGDPALKRASHMERESYEMEAGKDEPLENEGQSFIVRGQKEIYRSGASKIEMAQIEPDYGQAPLQARSDLSAETAEDMIFIGGSNFYMGIDHPECDASPKHEIYIADFYIDRYPVVNIQYADFAMVTGYVSEGNWQDYFTEGKEYYPVTGVTYNDALSYAYWLGKRLPTEAEWEKAARGEKGFHYPWGDLWDRGRLCSKEGRYEGPVAVDSFWEGVSPYGGMSMLGNTWEWTFDHYGPYPYKPYPVQDINREVVIRGGDWLTELEPLGAAVRAVMFADEYSASVGFRCARAPGEPE